MNWDDLAVIGVFLLVLLVPVSIGWISVRAVRRRRDLRIIELRERGSVHATELSLYAGIVIFLGGVFLAGAGIIPVAAWLIDGDEDGRRVAIVMSCLLPSCAALGFVVAIPSFRYYVVEPTRLVATRFGRERSIEYADVAEVHRSQHLTGGVVFVAHQNRMRVSGQVDGFDELVDRVMSRIDVAAQPSPAPSTVGDGAGQVGRREFSVSSTRTRVTLSFMGGLLIFFVGWPWFFVGGEHPVRDSFIFAGIGVGLWAGIALLVRQESFQPSQPAQLRLHDAALEYRRFRRGWERRCRAEFFVASVVPNIIYVKGMPGKRHPLVVGFADGTGFIIDDMRAKHMGTTTHLLAAELRRLYLEPALTTTDDRALGAEWLASADAASGPERISALRTAIAADPELSVHLRELGDLQRRNGQLDDAVLSYHAHLDLDPDDHRAYEGLVAAHRANGRDDLAADAAAATERLVLG